VGAQLGRKVRGLKVPAARLADYVEQLLRTFLATRHESESFAVWASRAPEPWLKSITT